MHDTRRTRVVLAVLLVVALTLIAADFLGGSGPLRTIGSAVFGTAERAVRSATRPVAGFLERGSGTGWSSRREQALEQEVIRLRARLSGEQLSRRDYTQLARLPRLHGPGRSRVIAASVIAVGQGYQQAVTLDVGTRDGVAPPQTVLNAAGVVGTVTSAGP